MPSIYPQLVDASNFSVWKHLKVAIFGRAKIGVAWIGNGLGDIFLSRCRIHDVFFLDYPHGYSQVLSCPKCQEASKSD